MTFLNQTERYPPLMTLIYFCFKRVNPFDLTEGDLKIKFKKKKKKKKKKRKNENIKKPKPKGVLLFLLVWKHLVATDNSYGTVKKGHSLSSLSLRVIAGVYGLHNILSSFQSPQDFIFFLFL
jgi:hypothetical protein